MIISAFAAFVSAGGAPRASISMGKGDNGSAEKILGGCFFMQIIISAVLTALLLIFDRDLLLAFGASENTIEYAVDYMNIYAIGTVFVQLTLGMNAFITAQGFANIGMVTVMIGAVSNIVLDRYLSLGCIWESGAPRSRRLYRSVSPASGSWRFSSAKRQYCA